MDNNPKPGWKWWRPPTKEHHSHWEFQSPPTTTKTSRWGFREKTVWDWLPLLIVPFMLALITVVFTWQQNARQQRIENQRAEAERELATQRAQDEALQAYLDQMSQLILQRGLLESNEGDPAYTLAQARTSTIILRLDSEHNESVIRFLSDSGLTGSSDASVSLLKGIALENATLSEADLSEADLNGADLSWANLSDANLSDANLYKTNLRHASSNDADLSGANLTDAVLSHAFLSGAILSDAFLSVANLSDADLHNGDGAADLSDAFLIDADLSSAGLYKANLRDTHLDYANLREAYLGWANLRYAHLIGAKLRDANLTKANLYKAKGISEGRLGGQAETLKGAIMPNGQKYEEWLNSREEDGQGG